MPPVPMPPSDCRARDCAPPARTTPPRKRSISSAVLRQPRLMRMALPAVAASAPMARRTCDGCTFPDEQAEPALTATPARSSAITCSSLVQHPAARGNSYWTGAPPPARTRSRRARPQGAPLEIVAQVGELRRGVKLGSSDLRGDAEADDARKVLRAGAPSALLPAAALPLAPSAHDRRR